MTQLKNISLKEIKAKLQVKKPWDSVIILLLNILIAIPVFIIIHQQLIDPEWPFQIDRILLFLSIVVIIQLILRLLRTIIIICIAFYLIALIQR